MVDLTVLQMCSTPDVAKNLTFIEQQLALLPPSDNRIVVLPECCLYFGGKDKDQLALAQQNAHSNYLLKSMAELAKSFKVDLVAGSMPIICSKTNKFYNASCVFSKQGEQLGQYNKLHLFDVNVADNEGSYFESRYTQAGDELKTLSLGEVTLGLSICYDLRFPELYRQLAMLGANVITVPSAFTKVTGAAHWQVLLQARAIENQVYIVAAGQGGIHENGRETWGHSMIINPWGEIVACVKEGQSQATAQFSLTQVEEIRQAMPVASHNKFTTKLKSYE